MCQQLHCSKFMKKVLSKEKLSTIKSLTNQKKVLPERLVTLKSKNFHWVTYPQYCRDIFDSCGFIITFQ